MRHMRTVYIYIYYTCQRLPTPWIIICIISTSPNFKIQKDLSILFMTEQINLNHKTADTTTLPVQTYDIYNIYISNIYVGQYRSNIETTDFKWEVRFTSSVLPVTMETVSFSQDTTLTYSCTAEGMRHLKTATLPRMDLWSATRTV